MLASNFPCTESYLSKCAMAAGSAKSLMATKLKSESVQKKFGRVTTNSTKPIDGYAKGRSSCGHVINLE
jgi:hypothetical protein